MIDEVKLLERAIRRADVSIFGVDKCAITLNELRDIVESLPKVGEWIPCSERLPEAGIKVLAFIKHNYMEDGWREYRTYEYTDHFVGMGNLCEAVAWMPLPESYKGV